MLYIDGSHGEGGGQVLRTSLALACLSQTSIQIINIRAQRPKPGLQAQHLQSVRAAAAICHAKISGDKAGSQSLYFEPNPIEPGEYRFDIGTAGATTLVLQTIFLPLCFAAGESRVTITGGTHVPWSPVFHYLDEHWLPCLRQMGVHATLHLDRAGFYPPGGGQIRAEIHPVEQLTPIEWTERGQLIEIRGVSAAAKLPAHVSQRQRDQARTRLGNKVKIETLEMFASSPGSMMLLLAEFQSARGCFFGLGKKGKPAEFVADEAVNGLENFLSTSATVDKFLADQLLLPFALANNISRIHTVEVTQHLLTNASVIEQFGQAKITIEGSPGNPAQVQVIPRQQFPRGVQIQER
jgi:RNA 3'-terminal phosphate cyclase (ATP)